MAEIQNAAYAAKGGHRFLGGAANFFGWGEEDGGVDISLEGNARAELLAEGAYVDTPVDAEDVGAGAGYSG